MDTSATVADLADRLRENQVFGPIVERDGVTLLPVAEVRGGGGVGTGGKEGEDGSGGGFGLSAKPAGAWVISAGRVSWQPAVDVNRAILGGQVVGIVALLLLGRLLRRRK
ncbi:MAG: hypothetical protein ACRDOY_14275 [Nocardioidaceae bacterium]